MQISDLKAVLYDKKGSIATVPYSHNVECRISLIPYDHAFMWTMELFMELPRESERVLDRGGAAVGKKWLPGFP